MILEIIIPTYKRYNELIRSVKIILFQISSFNLNSFVSLRVVDDCSPNFDKTAFKKSFSDNTSFTLEINNHNKGMNKNIYDSVRSSEAQFCTILTDDDWLESNSLIEICKLLQEIIELKYGPNILGFVGPRYSFRENGELSSIVCKMNSSCKVLPSGPFSAVRYCKLGFILTGLIFKPSAIDFKIWSNNLDNAYFPLLYLAQLLNDGNFLYYKNDWFHHIVLNECHWESWGSNEVSQYNKITSDYLMALDIIHSRYVSKNFLIYVSSLYELFLFVSKIDITYVSSNSNLPWKSKSLKFIFSISWILFAPLRYFKRIKSYAY